MGFARLFNRNLQYVATNTETGETATYTVVTTDTGLKGMYPNWSEGDYRGGMGLPGCWRAALLVSDLLASVPWHAYRSRAGRAPTLLDPPPALLARPCPTEPRVNTFSAWVLDLLWHGNAIGLIAARGADGWPTAVLPVPAESVYVKRVQEADQLPWQVGTIVYQVGTRWYAADDVLHVKGPHKPGALRGIGIIEQHLATTLTLSDELDKQARGIADTAVPSVAIKSLDPDLSAEDAAALKSAWMASQTTRVPVVLNPSTDVQPLAWNPTETQLLEARKFSLHNIALLFGLDPSWLGVTGASMTYSNIEQEGLKLLKFSIGGHLARFEQTLSDHMPRGTWAQANLDGLLRGDTLSRYQAHGIAIQYGILTRDEVRAIEDRPPLTAEQRAEVIPATPLTPPAPDAGAGIGRGALADAELDDAALDDAAAGDELRDNPFADGSQLHHYWTKGEGLAKWAHSPHPWTALERHLLKYLPPKRAKATAAKWYHDVFGHWPGERKGKNPVGKG